MHRAELTRPACIIGLQRWCRRGIGRRAGPPCRRSPTTFSSLGAVWRPAYASARCILCHSFGRVPFHLRFFAGWHPSRHRRCGCLLKTATAQAVPQATPCVGYAAAPLVLLTGFVVRWAERSLRVLGLAKCPVQLLFEPQTPAGATSSATTPATGRHTAPLSISGIHLLSTSPMPGSSSPFLSSFAPLDPSSEFTPSNLLTLASPAVAPPPPLLVASSPLHKVRESQR